MNSTYLDNWQVIKESFGQWWKGEPRDKPLMKIIAPGKAGAHEKLPAPETADPRDKFLNVRNIIAKYRNFCETHYFLADAFPAANVDLGPGSIALYLGGEPIFTRETIWYEEKFTNPEEFRSLHYDENNPWWVTQQNMIKEALELARGDFYITIPDFVENLDILSAMRGPQNLCFDIMDDPEAVRDGVKIIDDCYFKYYDACYDLLMDTDFSSSYMFFDILGKGRVSKLQCDFSALISPLMFREFVQPSLTKQCRNLDYSLYHLDGPDAIKHVPALMEIDELNALQWSPGAGNPDGGSPKWYPIYDQVRAAGKSLWISLEDGGPEDWALSAQRLVKRYGPAGLYFIFPIFPDLAQAQKMAALFE